MYEKARKDTTMDINEKDLLKGAPQQDGPRPQDGKRPNRNHHRRGKGRSGGQGKPAAEAGQNPQSNQNQGQKKNDRSQAPRNNGDNRSGNQSAGRAEAAVPGAEAIASPESIDRRNRPSTGRPQRVPHHSAEAALPNMDDLLIEDGMNPARAMTQSEDEVDAAEIERILERDLSTCRRETIPEVIPEGKVVIVGIRFRAGGKTYFFDPGELVCTTGQYAIVETARGLEFGEVYLGNRMLDESKVVPPLRPVIRLATEADIAHNRENHEREEDAFRIGVQKIREHKLDMKLVSVQYTFDNSKLLFYFTSAKRVDFRDLVKDLAGVFHIRIELRQIGIRDEARMIGGLGPCGRPLCCNTFLSDFGQVSMKMAKEQNLSLNSTKISGCCGRLMCCLRYEHETYASELRLTPAVGSFVNTPDGPGVVTEVYLLKGEVKVSLRGQADSAPKKYKRELVELQVRDRRPPTPDTEDSEEPEGEDTI